MSWRALWRSLTGEDAYEVYLSLLPAGQEPMGEREFWRHRMDEHEPGVGCC